MISLERNGERKLLRWGAAYLAGALLLLQVLGLLAQPLRLVDMVLRAATVLLGVGFFGVLVLARLPELELAARTSSSASTRSMRQTTPSGVR